MVSLPVLVYPLKCKKVLSGGYIIYLGCGKPGYPGVYAKVTEVLHWIHQRVCACDVVGSNCDVLTGQCSCKLNVRGKKCSQCAPQHYGLSVDNAHGCQVRCKSLLICF